MSDARRPRSTPRWERGARSGTDTGVGPPSPHETGDEEVLGAVTEAARRLATEEARVVTTMTQLLRTIDDLDVDARMVDLMEASIAGNVNTILHLFSRRIPIEQLQPTTAAVAYAAYLAERGVSVHSLVRAYTMGEQWLLQELFDELAASAIDAELRSRAMRHVSAVLHRYVDWITRYLIDAYERARARWEEGGPSVHAALVLAVLAGEPGSAASLTAATGYDLGQQHVALLAWVGPDGAPDGLAVVEDAVRRLSRAVAGTTRMPLVAAADRATLWAWLPCGTRDRPVPSAAIAEVIGGTGVHVSHGLVAPGEEGFRSSHEQAVATHRLALAATVPPTVLGFADEGVAAVAGMARDMVATRVWVRAVLGGLAARDEDVAPLRETVATHLRLGSSATRTAEALHLHRNSVRYRLARAEELRGRPLTQAPTDLAVALRACELLGDAALADRP